MMIQSSDIFAITALIISLTSILFTIIVHNRDRRRELETYIYKEKQVRYQQIFRIGTQLIYYKLDSIENEIDSIEVTSSIERVIDLSEELMLLAPSSISVNTTSFATSLYRLAKTFVKKNEAVYDHLYRNVNDQHIALLTDFKEDLNTDNLNHSLKRRTQSGFSTSDMNAMIIKSRLEMKKNDLREVFIQKS